MYKTYFSKKHIFWNSLEGADRPNPDIEESWFQWTEIPLGQGAINCVTWDTGSTIIKDKDITYFKVEKYSNDNILQHTKYFFVNSINKVLKNGYEVEVVLDIWMTYSRHIFKAIRQNNHPVLVNRMSLYDTLWDSEKGKNLLRIGLTTQDELLDNIIPLNPKQWFSSVSYKISREANLPSVGKVTLKDKQWNKSDDVKNIMHFGIYFVFLNKRTGKYDLYPVQCYKPNDNAELANNISPYLYETEANGTKYFFKNTFSELEANLVNRIQADYGADGFLGVYRGYSIAPLKDPSLNYNNQDIRWNIRVVKSDSTPAYTLGSYLYFSIIAETPLYIEAPYSIHNPKTDSMVATGAALNEYILFANDLIKKKDLFWFNEDVFNNKYILTFNKEFILIPFGDKTLSQNRMISYGGQLPSASGQYASQLAQSKYRYDSGLGARVWNLGTSALKGLGSLVGYGLSLPTKIPETKKEMGLFMSTTPIIDRPQVLKDISSTKFDPLIGSLGGPLQQFIKAGYRYRTENHLASASLYATDTINTYWINSFITTIEKWNPDMEIFDTTDITNNPYDSIHNICLTMEYDEYTQSNILQTYNLYGFPIFSNVKIGDVFQNNQNPVKFYIEFNETWLTLWVKHLITRYLPTFNVNNEELLSIINNLNNGIRIWFNNNPDYFNYKDKITN